MKFTSVAIALLAFAFSARPATVTYTPGTGVLLYPANFFEANSNAIVQAISGAFSGTGSGNASTNAAQGWSASQTFNAPVMFGPTNAVTAIAGKQDLDTDLTDLADGSLTGSKVGTGITADNITAGTLASNRLPAAVSFTTIDAGTLNATAVVGDASGLTGINATNITAGTLPDARLSANVGLTNAVVLKAGDTMTGDLSVPDEAYGAGWDSSVDVPTKNAVYDQVQLRAPLASPALTGTPTVNGTNLMAEVNARVLRAGDTMTGTLTLAGTAAAGTSNSVAASTKYVDDAVAAVETSGGAAAKSQTTFFLETEFLAAASAIYSAMPWAGTANASGASGQGPVSGQNRPTISRLSSAANANSGYAYTTYSGNALRLYGGERFTVVFRPQATNDGVMTRYGWHDTTSSTAPTDALMVVRSNFVMTGYAYSNSVVVPTATTYNISSNAWYRIDISINGDGSVGTFTLFDENASQVWSDSVTNALPLSDARLVGNGVNTYNVNAAAVALEDFDYMSLGNTNTLTR